MSRTFRKRPQSFNDYYHHLLDSATHEDFLKKEQYRYRTKTEKFYTYNLPRFYRNMVNRKRRAHDRTELFRELNHFEYIGAYSKWNCKDSNAWGYW